jgi:hypothetical protein
MATSSADPDRLEAYPGRLTQADDELTTLAGDLDDAMSAFSTGAGTFRPAAFDASAAGSLVRGLRDESQYLGGWVASVGFAFREADRLGIPPDQLDNFIGLRVGEATLADERQHSQGEQDANALRQRLAALGINPYDFDPAQLRKLDPRDPRYTELFNLMDRIGHNMWNQAYATGFYTTLGVQGIRATLGVIETFAAHQVWTPSDEHGRPMAPVPDFGSIRERLLEPFVLGFALATRSADLDDIERELLHPGTDVNSDARWRQHQLSLLLSADGHHYDPAFLAAGADVILVSNRNVNWINSDYGPHGSPYDTDYPALYMGPRLWDGDVVLAVPQAIALRALSQSDEASWQFAGMGRDNLEAILRPSTYQVEQLPFGPVSTGWDYDEAQQVKDLMQQFGAGAVHNAFVDVPTDDPSRYQEALGRYADVVRIVGEGDIPDGTKRTVANSFGLYVDDIGHAALVMSEDVHHEGQPFSRPELVDFFRELGHDKEAAAQVGESITAWTEFRGAVFLGDHRPPGDLTETMRPVSLVMGAVEDGFDGAAADATAAREAFAIGARHAGAFAANFAIGFVASGGNPVAGGVWAGVAGTAGSVLLQGTDIMAHSGPPPDVTGGRLEVTVLGQLRQDMATTVAQQHDLPPPQPGQYSSTLGQYRPDLRDALDDLDRDATDEKNDYGDEDDWSTR